MKYLSLSEHYLPHKGGAFIWLHEVCKRLGEGRVLTKKRKALPDRQWIEGVDVRRIRLQRCPILRPESLILYANLAIQGLLQGMRIRPDVIIAARVLPEGLIATIVGRRLRIPSLVLAHGEEITTWGDTNLLSKRRQITSEMKRNFLWNVYRKTNQIVANSNFTRQLLINGGVSADKIAVVHPGTDTQKFRPMPKNQQLLSQWNLHDRKVLLTVGRLSKRKGHDMVIQALPAILQAIPEAVYLIVGIGDYERTLRKMVSSLCLNSHVYFLGEVEDELLPEIYNLANVFLMPNRKLTGNDVEGFGIVFLEASACAIPVIGGRSGGVPDAIYDGKTGILTDGNSPGEIAKATIRILRNQHTACQMGEAGRNRVCEKFTWNHSTEKIGDLLNKICKQKKHGFRGSTKKLMNNGGD